MRRLLVKILALCGIVFSGQALALNGGVGVVSVDPVSETTTEAIS